MRSSSPDTLLTSATSVPSDLTSRCTTRDTLPVVHSNRARAQQTGQQTAQGHQLRRRRRPRGQLVLEAPPRRPHQLTEWHLGNPQVGEVDPEQRTRRTAAQPHPDLAPGRR